MNAANSPLYQLAPDVTMLKLRDALDGRFALLTSMLVMTCGENGESFRGCNDEIQDSYLFGAEALAREIHELYKQLEARMVTNA